MLSGSGCRYCVVPCAGTAESRYTAAEARNAGLSMLLRLPDESPIRREYLLFLDDDTAIDRNALGRLIRLLDCEKKAVAACPSIEPVDDLTAWHASIGDRRQYAGQSKLANALRLPGPIIDDRYDLLSVTAYGSLVTGRTVGLLVRQPQLLQWIKQHGELFYSGTPYGSCEDILAMATLSCFGQLWLVPSAVVADEARKSPGTTRTQQFAWGYDHAWLVRRFAESGLVSPEVQALDWISLDLGSHAGWEASQADWHGSFGFLVNPEELHLGHRILCAIVAAPAVATQLFGDNAAAVRAGVHQLGRVLARWSTTEPSARRERRPDLPRLANRNWSSLREGLDSFVGHLAGNVAGSWHNDEDRGELPRFFLYGARQPAGERQDLTRSAMTL